MDWLNISSRMDAYKWADENGYKYARSRIGVGIYAKKFEGTVTTLYIADGYCALYRVSKGRKADRLLKKRTYEVRS